MTKSFYLSTLIFRVVLPITMWSCVVFRPCLLSGIYLLLSCYLPFVPVPKASTMKGHTGIFLKLFIAIAVLNTLLQITFQILLVVLRPYGFILENCDFLEKVLRHVGFVRMNHISAPAATAWLSPEILMLITSIAGFLVLRKLTSESDVEQDENVQERRTTHKKAKLKFMIYMVSIGRYVVLFTMYLAAVLRPSVQGGLYFFVFLCAATHWACYKKLSKKFAIILRCLAVLVFVHLAVFFAYQTQWPQEYLEPNSTYARYFALTPLYSYNCSDPREFIFNPVEWDYILNPFAIYAFFYFMILLSKGLMKPEVKAARIIINFNRRPAIKTKYYPSETSPLIRNVSPRHNSRRIIQDSTGSVTITGDNQEEIPMDVLGKGTTEPEYKPTLLENIFDAFGQVLQVIINSSYIATNIIMMTWSITYLSWITFVLLIWANVLWLIPNQRKSMLRSSPFLVFYAWFLLISAYIYSMNLTEEELPSIIKGINMKQIGFVKVQHLPCNPLLVKCLFTAMFWITLRQYMHERFTERQSSALADMVAPLQVTVGTATGVNTEQPKTMKMMDKIGAQLSTLLTKFFIWVVAITLFAVAITGERMTVFRIIYMALFLFFILSFQISFRLWRKMMFAFWLTVIVYSMIILVMVYTYQFDNFPEYWEQYLHVPKQQQLDIGLEIFETRQLFVRLVTPTFFVIITVIQLHYFHKDFMMLSNPRNSINIGVDLDESSLQGGAGAISERTASPIFSEKNAPKKSRLTLENLSEAIDVLFVFMEIHMPKIVIFMAMLLCVYDKCALYLLVIVLIVLALTFGRPMMVISIFATSCFASVLLLSRMIYQIQYIEPDVWNVTCPPLGNSTGNGTSANNAPWLGFVKSSSEKSLPSIVKWNIIYILMVTLWSVIIVRQYNHRISKGQPPTRAYFVFPNITRDVAEKSLRNFVKYLANYMFFKFGVELSLMATVGLIGTRMDFYALLYSFWLLILMCCLKVSRATLSRVWNLYLIFIAVLLPIQYVMVVGIPPTLCVDYPWDHSETLIRLQEWAYLMDDTYPPSPKKLICDFVVLLLVSRQALVFRIEKRHAGKRYAGGSNESIIHLAEDSSFSNPVPDFITYVRSYLDIVKRVVLPSFLWITMAVMFLAGTNRVNIFSIGYLLGAFIFLWQGSDLYLKPIPKILKSWDMLIFYNVVSILVKVALQIVGCVYIHTFDNNTCWMVQLFGVGCVRKFGNFVEMSGIQDPEECKVPREFVGLVWDGICFGFLITQRRIFQSYNFFHMIDEIKAVTILASRGADLIEELRQERIQEQEELERKVLEKIKTKMDRIKATQQKLQDNVYQDSKNHFVDTVFQNRPRRRRATPKTYKQAVRSGDYYMFDDLEDEDLDVEQEELPLDMDDPANKNLKPALGEIKELEKEEKQLEPQASTSKDDEISELTEPPPQPTLRDRLLRYAKLCWMYVEGAMVSVTNFLNRYSKDYRYIIRVLSKEKKILKEKTTYTVGNRVGSAQIWQPAGSYHSLLRQAENSNERVSVLYSEFEEGEMSSYDQPPIARLCLAIWYIVMSRTELLCYFFIFLNQIKSATFLSLPLPLMVFFWGSLTVPRPSKTFWVTIIAYTEIIVFVKCMFQFDIIPWNQNVGVISNPFYPPKIIGIERKKAYAVWDLLLLLVVFFHRVMLKSMGLWKSIVPVPAVLISEGEYKLEDGTLVPVNAASKSSEEADRTERDEAERRDGEDSTIVPADDEELLDIERDEVTPFTDCLAIFKKTASKYTESIQLFFYLLLDPSSKQATDVYSFMFMCDFFNFFVILIGYSSFGAQQGDGGVSSYLEDNRVPALFLVMLILQFMLIIIDRGIFLRKNIIAKLIFQYIQILFLHIWLFVLFPVMTGTYFNSVLPPQMYYMVKCFYLLLSAYQIRCGYPTRILGNFLCKGYSYLNMFLFKGFMFIPFLFELRTVMDWMWTDTSMTVFDWIKMEDIFQHIFQLKCTRHVEDKYPQERGERKKPLVKYFMGGALLAAIIGIIWFPLVFFSLGNAVGEPNLPYDVTLEIRIGPYEPVYQMSAQNNSFNEFSEADYQQMLNAYSSNKAAISFISNYLPSDISAVRLNTDSANIWSISPPDRQRMVEEIKSYKPLTVRLEYKISHRTSKPEDSGVIPESVEIIIPPPPENETSVMREDLLKMLNGIPAPAVPLNYLLPKFVKVTNRGTAKPIGQLMGAIPDESARRFRNLTLNLLRSSAGAVTSSKEWWQIHETCHDTNYNLSLSKLPYHDCGQIILYTFNDKIFPSTLNLITGGGIIGLYTTLVFVASRVLRGFFNEQCFKIMFEDMPNVDRVLQLCFDIYLVREAREFTLEEDLFAKLVFLYRSPETMIKWTRPKEEVEDDDNPEGEGQ
ncbi:piezo-type mechanosensitive ion channel component isoform X3 [Aethina tumida]|uniref:piezo-type mechanosensitive ion channel component isoform X3 n=1 Tax=Aethina tumida TaxID=116153 RepID=UPI00214969A1|nr:piezo-type mechanosensitive ion channel component isoform X3 [Aethina tumida]